jgi:MraZ protein
VAELLGTHSYQLDPKGRISLPGRFREAFADGAVLTLGQDGCLFCFPRAEWTARAAEIRDLPLSDTDGQGRLLVPQRLRHEAGIGKEAVVLGVSDRMEIWDRTAHERYETAHAGAYQAGTLAPGAKGMRANR